MLSRENLHKYQLRTIEFFKKQKRCAAFLDMGMGKSVSTLTALSDMLDCFAVNRVLVIGPLRVANSVWKQEAAQWQHLRHLDISVCTGSLKKRCAALHAPADIFVINRENVTWLVEFYGKKWPFDCVIIDESSSFKNSSSKRFKALRKVLPTTTHVILLTGTPSPNGLLDLWPQMYLIDYGERLGKTLTGYKQRFFEPDYMGYNWTLKSGAEDKIHNLIADKCLSMSASDYLELPERIDLIENIDLPNKILKAYLEFEKNLFTQFDDVEIEPLNAASLAGKLLQWCNGAMYIDDNKNYIDVHSIKLDALGDIIEANEGENILVAYNFKSDLERLTARFPQARQLDQAQSTIDDWNAGKIPLLLAHPASAGHGLNIQRGGSLIVWFGLNWSLELYQQFNARLHRQGQLKPVRVVHLVTHGCIDERVMMALSQKDATQKNLLNSLKPLA